jgi:flagellar assembly factor FliW
MYMDSPRFGRIEIDEDRVYTFPDGLLGFRDAKRYVFHEPQPNSIITWMQSLDMPALAFVVMDPRLVKPDYEVRVTAAQLEPLGIKEPSKARVWVTLTIPADPSKMTANLLGPLVTNPETRLAAQIVINDESVTTKYPVMENLRAQGRMAAGRG